MSTIPESLVVHATPPGVAEVVRTACELEDLQRLVGGYIEALQVNERLWLLCNEEGRSNGMRPLARVGNHEIFGPFVLLATEGEDFVGLEGPEALSLSARINAGEPFGG